MLGRGELRCIGATTIAEYRKYIEKVRVPRNQAIMACAPEWHTHACIAMQDADKPLLCMLGAAVLCASHSFADLSHTSWSRRVSCILAAMQDAALERRFQQVMVDPPSVLETVSILRGLREK